MNGGGRYLSRRTWVHRFFSGFADVALMKTIPSSARHLDVERSRAPYIAVRSTYTTHVTEPENTTPPPIKPHADLHPGRQVIAFIAIIAPFAILALLTYLSWNQIKAFVERFYQ